MEILTNIIAFVIIFAIVITIITFPIMWLWNWLMPVIFGLPIITFWQALGLNLLSSLLIRSATYNTK